MSEKSEPLASQTCVSCAGSTPPATAEEISRLLAHLSGWLLVQVGEVPQLQKQYRFKNFRQALAFTNEVGAVAEAAGHHPALLTEWGKVTVSWWTHVVGGLHRNDFVMAAKTDEIAERSAAERSAVERSAVEKSS